MTTISGMTGTGVSLHTDSLDGMIRSGDRHGVTAHGTGASMIRSGTIRSGARPGAGASDLSGVILSSTAASTSVLSAHGDTGILGSILTAMPGSVTTAVADTGFQAVTTSVRSILVPIRAEVQARLAQESAESSVQAASPR